MHLDHKAIKLYIYEALSDKVRVEDSAHHMINHYYFTIQRCHILRHNQSPQQRKENVCKLRHNFYNTFVK